VIQHSRRRLLVLTAVFALSLLSCGREVTGPGNGLNYGRARTAALALDPHMPTLFAQLAGASDVVPFERVRIVLLRDDATVALDTIVNFPAGADSLALTLTVPLPLNTPDEGLPLALSMAYINTQGDTVFRAGPSNILALPVGSTGSSQPIILPVRYDGVGAGASAVVIAPDSLVVVAGTSSSFTAEALDGQGAAIPNTPLLFFTIDSTRAVVADPGVGGVTWLPVRGTARIVAALPDGARADTAFVTVELPASQLALGSGSAQVGPIGATLPQPLVARVLAADGVPVPGVEVLFAVTTGGGSLSIQADTSDANGDVQTSWTLGTALGAQTVTATANGLTGSPLVFTATADPSDPVQLAILAQPVSGIAGAALVPALIVAVQDIEGNTVPSYTGAVSLAFADVGDATLGGTTTVNAVAGLATFADLSIDLTGTYALVASSDTLLVAATAPIAIAPAAASTTEIVAQPTDGVAGVPLPAFSAVALDAFANLATDFVGVVTITAERDGVPANVLVAGDTVTAIDGVATFNAVRIDSAGTYTLVLDFGSIGTIETTAFTVVPAAASTIALLDGDAQGGVVSGALAAPLRVRVTDDFGNGIGGVDVTWDIVTGLATLSATVVPTDADGIAATTVLLGLIPSTIEVTASAAGLVGSPVSFTASATAGAATQLTMETEPAATTEAGATLAPIVVAARDAQGNIATGFVGTVEVDIETGVAGATLGGALAANAVAGIATFDQLVIETSGAYTLRFTSVGLTDTVTTAFEIVPAAPFVMQVLDGDAQSDTVGFALPNTLRAEVLDIFGNGVAGQPVAWSITAGSGTLLADTVLTDVDGVAAQQLTLGTVAGDVTVEATIAGLNGSPVVFSATALAAAPAVLGLSAAPDTVAAGAVADPIVVTLRDAFGNAVESYTGDVTIVASDAPGDFAAGTTTVAAVGGVATFDDLVFNELGGWFLDVSTAGFTVGVSLEVVAGAPAAFTIVAGNAQVGVASSPLPQSLVARVTDALGNAVSGQAVAFTVTAGGGTLAGGGALDSVITNSAGDAVTTWTLGPDTLTAQTVEATLAGFPALAFTATAEPNIANRTWTGAASTLWTDAANWAELTVPVAADSVRIPAGATFMPELAGDVALARLTIEDGATLNMQSQILTVSGNLTVPTALAFVNIGEGAIEMVGVGEVRGALPRLTVRGGTITLGSQVDVSGDVTVVDGGDIATGAQTLLVAGSLETQTGGTLTMTGPGTVAVDGDVIFLGGSTVGRLTAGELSVGGNFAVTGAAGSYSATAGHTLRMSGFLPGTMTVSIADPANNPLGTFVVSEATDVSFGAAGAIILGNAILEGTTATATVTSEVAIAGGLIDSVGGRWTGGTTRFLNDAPLLPVAIGGTVAFAGAVSLTDSLNVGAELRINQPTGVLDLNGHRVRAGEFQTSEGGRLVMDAAADSLVIAGQANFSGGVSTLTAGYLEIGESLFQGTTADALQAGPAHETRLVGTALATLSFTNPGFGAGTSHLGRLVVAKSTQQADIALASDVFVNGVFETLPLQFYTLTSGNNRVVSRGASVSDITFVNTRWEILDGATVAPIANVTFDEMDVTATQLRIARGGGTVQLQQPTFLDLPVGGLLLVADDVVADADILTVAVTSPTPSFAGANVQALNGAVVTGWDAQPDFTWVGVTTDWTAPSNWSEGLVPTSASTVDIPLAATITPIIPSGITLASLGVATELPVVVNGTLTITDNLFVPVTLGAGLQCADTARVRFEADGAPSEFRGRIGCFVEVATGELRVAPTVYADSVTVRGTALLDIGGGVMEVDSTFRTIEGGRLRMADPADVLIARSSAIFQGGSTSGLLTAGTLSVYGGVFQGGAPSSLDATLAHRTNIFPPFDIFAGDPTLTLSNPDSSGFAQLFFIAGRSVLNSRVTVRGNVDLEPGIEVADAGNGLGALDIAGDLTGGEDFAELFLPRLWIGGSWGYQGSYAVDTTYLTGTGQFVPASAGGEPLFFSQVEILGSATVAYATTDERLDISGNLIIRDGGRLTVGQLGSEAAVDVGGDLVTEGSGVLVMQVANAEVNVAGTARFGGGSTEGLLTAGLLNLTSTASVDTTFIQLAGNSGSSYAASEEHVTAFTGGNQSAYFQSPGYGTGNAHFGQLLLNHVDGQLELYSDAFADGQVRTVLSGENVSAPLPQALHTRGADLPASLSFDNAGWVLTDGEAVSVPSGVSFFGMDPDAVQFAIQRAGDVVSIANLTFTTMPSAGLYLRVTDTAPGDANDLVVNLGQVTPSSSGGFAIQDAPASVVGWDATAGGFPLNAWTGAVDGNWSTAANWSLARVPLPADSVVIGLTGASTVTMDASATVAYLDVGDALGTATPTFNHTLGNTLQVDSIGVFYAGSTLNVTGGSTLTGDGSVVVFGNLVFDGATMSGEGVTSVSAGGTATIAGTGQVTLADRALAVLGQATVGASGIAASGVATVGISTGGVLDFQAATSLFVGGEVSLVVAGGTLRISPPGADVVRIDWPVSNAGRIEVASGTLDLREALAHTGSDSILVRSGSTLLHAGNSDIFASIHVEEGGLARFTGGAFGGTHVFYATSAVSGPGSIEFDGADSVAVNGSFDIGSLVSNASTLDLLGADTVFVGGGAFSGGGFLRGTGVLGIRGAFSSTGGNPNGTGTIAVLPGGTFALNSPLLGWNLDVGGTLVWGDSDIGLGAFGGQNPQILIRTGGLLDIQHGATPRSWSGVAANVLTNNGTIRKSTGSATATIVPLVSNPGLIESLAGGLAFPSGCTNIGAGTGCP
jgi:hypothetical protein